MQEVSRERLVVHTIRALEHSGSWCGETHLQKCFYLAQEFSGETPMFKYVLYKHGPYSFELSDCLEKLIAEGVVSYRPRTPPYGPSLEVSETSAKFRNFEIESDKITTVVEKICTKLGASNVSELERLATALFVSIRLPNLKSLEERGRYINSIKPHVSVEAAKKAEEEVLLLRSIAA